MLMGRSPNIDKWVDPVAVVRNGGQDDGAAVLQAGPGPGRAPSGQNPCRSSPPPPSSTRRSMQWRPVRVLPDVRQGHCDAAGDELNPRLSLTMPSKWKKPSRLNGLQRPAMG